MATTIRDVAHRAGVSIATVSRALRDADSVTPETRARVARAAADLEYVPSQLGRQLAQGRHAANGIVFPDLSGPYYAEVVLGYESVAAQLDRSVLILSTHGRARRRRPGHRPRRPLRRPGRARPHRRRRGRAPADPPRHSASCWWPARRSPTSTRSTPRTQRLGDVARRAPRRRRSARPILFVGDPDASADVDRALRGRQGGGRARAARPSASTRSPTSARRPARTPPARRSRDAGRRSPCPTPSSAPTTSWPSGC